MAPSTPTIDPKLLENVRRPQLDKKGRPVTKETKKGKEKTVMRDVTAEEVIDYRINAEPRRIGVVTDDGRKFYGDLPKSWKPPEEPTAETGDGGAKGSGSGDGK